VSRRGCERRKIEENLLLWASRAIWAYVKPWAKVGDDWLIFRQFRARRSIPEVRLRGTRVNSRPAAAAMPRLNINVRCIIFIGPAFGIFCILNANLLQDHR
jgi:hypothetical protein